MNIILVTNGFHPQLGGMADTLYNLHKSFQITAHSFYTFNPLLNGTNLFKVIKNRNYHFRELPSILFNKANIIMGILCLWKIIRDKKLSFSHRFIILSQILLKPLFLISIIENLLRIYPISKKFDINITLAGNSYWNLPISFILSRFLNTKIVSIAYGKDFILPHTFLLRSIIMRNLDKIIVISNPMKDLLSKIHRIDKEKITVIPVGVNIKDLEIKSSRTEWRNRLKISEKEFVLLSVGRHVARKRFNLVIRAVDKIRKLHPTIKLRYYLIGEGVETQYLKNLVKDLNLEDFVKFLGVCNIAERNIYYKLSDVFLMPSVLEKKDVEGFGIVFLEANYYKVPVIGSKMGGVADAIVDRETGLFANPNDVNDLVEKILFLFENEEIRKKMGENGYNRVINDFNWNKIVLEYIKVFKALK